MFLQALHTVARDSQYPGYHMVTLVDYLAILQAAPRVAYLQVAVEGTAHQMDPVVDLLL